MSTSAPTLPLDIFLLIAEHLPTASLSRLSRTNHTLHALLTPHLKRQHVFHLVGRHLHRLGSPCPVHSILFPHLRRDYRKACRHCKLRFHVRSLSRLSRTCRDAHHALAPFLKDIFRADALAILYHAIRRNSTADVKRYLAAMADNPIDLYLPLYYAIIKNRLQIVRVLLCRDRMAWRNRGHKTWPTPLILYSVSYEYHATASPAGARVGEPPVAEQGNQSES